MLTAIALATNLTMTGGHGPANARASQVSCLQALAALSPGEAPRADMFAVADCPAGRLQPAFAYDAQSGSSHARRAVGQGEIVPVFPEFSQNGVQPGQMLRIVVTIGPVRIERGVKALQAARQGHKLFVVDADGQVFSVRYEGAAQ